MVQFIHNNFSQCSTIPSTIRKKFVSCLCSYSVCSTFCRPMKLHILALHRSERLALVINNNLCIISLVTSDVLLEIPLDVIQSDEYNYLNNLAWSNNGKFIAYGHWSGAVCVYSSIDGQILHELTTKSVFQFF